MTLGALAVTAAVALAGCSPAGGGSGAAGGGVTEPVTQGQIDEAMSADSKLTFWTWVPEIQQEVDLFEKKYPNIDVEVVNTTGGSQQYPKLRAAIKSGKGTPDVVQIEYQYIPSFRQTENLLNLAPYGAEDMEGEYVDWIWNQVADDQGVWAIPQDAGPLGNLYRTDIWQAAGLTSAPETWDQFAEQAQAIRGTGAYISNMPGNDPGQMVGLFWQAGAKPFSYDGQETVSVNLDSEETQKVVSFWQELIQNDLVSTDADFNDEWYQGLSRGKYASWQVAAWGPIFLQGTAANTSGLWQAAKIPQWEEGEDVSGNWGGSTSAVLSNTKNAIVAAEFAKFINTDRESALMLANQQFLFPTTTEILEDPEFTGLTSEFYGGQKVNEFFAGVSETVDPEFEWLPFMDYVYSSYNDTLGKAISDKGDMVGALSEWQSKVVDYAEQQGFTVE
jgi:multiple sugar transport system substrate-binding protein